MYYNGHGVEKNWEKAKELYKAASATDKHGEELYNYVVKEEEKRISEETSKNVTKPDS